MTSNRLVLRPLGTLPVAGPRDPSGDPKHMGRSCGAVGRCCALVGPPGWVVAACVVGVLAGWVGGCSSEKFTAVEFVEPSAGSAGLGAEGARPDGSWAAVRADWDDIDAAVSAGLWKHEAAVVSRRVDDVGMVRFTLMTIRDERGELSFRRVEPQPLAAAGAQPGGEAGGGEPVLIEIGCAVGLSDRGEVERRIIRSVVHRLTQLRGVQTAPLD